MKRTLLLSIFFLLIISTSYNKPVKTLSSFKFNPVLENPPLEEMSASHLPFNIKINEILSSISTEKKLPSNCINTVTKTYILDTVLPLLNDIWHQCSKEEKDNLLTRYPSIDAVLANKNLEYNSHIFTKLPQQITTAEKALLVQSRDQEKKQHVCALYSYVYIIQIKANLTE